MLKIDRIEKMYCTYPNGVQVKVPYEVKRYCTDCGHIVEPHHRYCWYCGGRLIEAREDACEIHSSGESQLSELCTYGRDAQLIEPRTK